MYGAGLAIFSLLRVLVKCLLYGHIDGSYTCTKRDAIEYIGTMKIDFQSHILDSTFI